MDRANFNRDRALRPPAAPAESEPYGDGEVGHTIHTTRRNEPPRPSPPLSASAPAAPQPTEEDVARMADAIRDTGVQTMTRAWEGDSYDWRAMARAAYMALYQRR